MAYAYMEMIYVMFYVGYVFYKTVIYILLLALLWQTVQVEKQE